MLELKKIKRDDVVYECEHGENVKFIALEDVHQKEGDLEWWEFKARRVSTGEVVVMGVREGFDHYGPKLYKEPEYADPRTLEAKID